MGKGPARRSGDDPVAYADNHAKIDWSKHKGDATMSKDDEMITLQDKAHNKEASESKPVTVRDKSQAAPAENPLDKVAYEEK
jgi:hypothetical protein